MAFDISQFLKGLDDAARKRVEPALLNAVNKVATHTIGQAQKLAPVSQPNKYIASDAVTEGVNTKGKKIKLTRMIRNPRWTGHQGKLKESGTALPAEIVGSEIIAAIGFNTDYAAAVHERLDQHHDQGQAKFLSVPIQQANAAGMLGKMAEAEVKKAL